MEHAIEFVPDVRSAQSNDANALLPEPCCPSPIMRDLIGLLVAGPVDLDRELRLGAMEIEDVGGDGMLATELEAMQSIGSDAVPEARFRRRHLTTKGFGADIALTVSHRVAPS